MINDCRLLEAKRLLKYTDSTIQPISYERNFKDLQSFTQFFNARAKLLIFVIVKEEKTKDGDEKA